MRAVLDTCVMYPTVMREVLLGAAGQGLYSPLWSARILEEWRRAAAKLGPEGTAQAEAEIALLRANWPKAELPPAPGPEARLWLPDPADVHVLAVAVAGSADAIITMNAQDFPRGTLAEEGLQRFAPDEFLMTLYARAPEALHSVCGAVLAEANRLSGRSWDMRVLMKKARLPRLGKALTR